MGRSCRIGSSGMPGGGDLEASHRCPILCVEASIKPVLATNQKGERQMARLPHELKRIRLNLARSKEFPTGSARHGYEFVAPLDAGGHIDPALWRQHREHC